MPASDALVGFLAQHVPDCVDEDDEDEAQRYHGGIRPVDAVLRIVVEGDQGDSDGDYAQNNRDGHQESDRRRGRTGLGHWKDLQFGT